jgi:hypothetical protein
MANNLGQFPRKDFLPPNLVAFLAGVLLALVVGVVFKKIIDKVSPQRPLTAMRAQTATEASSAELNRPDLRTVPQKMNQVSADTENAPAAAENETSPAAASDVSVKTLTPSTATSETAKPPLPAQAATAAPQAKEAATVSQPVTKYGIEETESETTQTGEIDYLAWRKTMRSLEEMLKQQNIPVSAVTLTPRYRHQAKGLAITRGQFLDVVSRKIPTNLPTRKSNLGLVLHALGPADFNSSQYTKAANDSGTRLEPLCRSGGSKISTEGSERITVLLSNTPAFFKCLQDWLSTGPDFKNVSELSLIGFTRGPTFFGSITADKKLLSLQMWNPDWLVDNTVAIDETGRESLVQKRTLRLANVTRALGQPSDVRMSIPASTRPLTGPLIEPKDPTPAKPLVIGNFALVPSHMPRGSLIATAFTSAQKGRGKSVTVSPPGPGRAKALVLATKGHTLQFVTVTRE